MSIALFVLAGFLLGGVYSFSRARRWVLAAVLLAAAALAVVAGIAWAMPR